MKARMGWRGDGSSAYLPRNYEENTVALSALLAVQFVSAQTLGSPFAEIWGAIATLPFSEPIAWPFHIQ